MQKVNYTLLIYVINMFEYFSNKFVEFWIVSL